MGVKKTVFGSSAERRHFQKLKSRWGDDYNLWTNLPFLNIFTRDGLIDPDAWLSTLTVDDLDWQRLKKTSVDYVLCDRDTDRPLICIDFDGLQDGYNFGREYRVSVEHPDPWRNQITTLKLRVAHGSFFPYFVVGSRHFADISDQVRFCIVDGIIGEVLAKNATSDRFGYGLKTEDLGLSQEEWDTLPPWDQGELIDNWALDIEMGYLIDFNPVYAEVEKIRQELNWPRGSHRFVDAPGTKRNANGRLLEDPALWGAEAVVETEDVGTVTRTVWIPNFKAPGFTGLSLVEKIAELVALEEVRRRRLR